MQVGLAIGCPCWQAHHRHDRIAAIDNYANVGHALVAELGKYRIEIHAVLDQRLVAVTAQAVLATDDVGDVVRNFSC